MEDTQSSFGPVFPSITDLGRSIDLDAARAEIDAVITEALAINEEADNEIAFSLAECIAECQIVDEDCDRCVGGIIDRDINDAQAIIDRFDDRVRNTVQGDVSEAVGILISMGVPIQELFPPSSIGSSDPDADLVRTGDGEIIDLNATTSTATPVPPVVPTVIPPTVPVIPPADPGNPNSPMIQIAGNLPGGQGAVCPDGFTKPSSNLVAAGISDPGVRDAIEQRRFDFSRLTPEQLAAGGPFGYVLEGDTLYAQPIDWPSGLCAPHGPLPPTTTTTTTVTTVAPPPLIGTPLCNPNNADNVLEEARSMQAGRGDFTGLDSVRAYFNGVFGEQLPPEQPSVWDIIRLPGQTIQFFLIDVATRITQFFFSGAGGSGVFGETCNNSSYVIASLQKAFGDFAGGWLGLVPDSIRTQNSYSANLICQYLIPSGPEANSLRSRGLLTDAQWRLLVHANGLCEPWQRIIVDGMASVPTIDETNRAFKAGYINEGTYRDYLRRNGVLNDVDIETYARLGEFVPGPSDLVRFMVRDSFDDQVAAEGGLDSGFEQKFTGRAREWAAAQGMEESQFRYFWRAHWDYPSNTQLYEMLHRLRSDTPIPGTNRTATAVTADQVKRVIEINDMAPEWVDRLMAISYRPLTRVDARRAFELGDLDREGLRKSYLDLGYAPEDADTLVRFSETSSGPVRAKKLGYASTNEVLGWYLDAVISRDVAWDWLRQSGVPDQNIDRYLSTSENRRVADQRKKVLRAIQGRYNKGEFSDDQASRQLVDAGIDVSRIPDLIRYWHTLRESKYKAPTVKMLCDWWSQGIMTISEYERRLINLGYSLVDASRIMQVCQNLERERLEKEAEKFAKEAQQRQDREERKRKAAQREAERLAEKLRPCKPPPKPVCPEAGPAPASGANGQPQR